MGFFQGVQNLMRFVSGFPNPDDIYGTIAARAEMIGRARSYRVGEQEKQLKTAPGRSDDNLRCNLVRKAINQSVYLLVGKGVDFDLPGDTETPEEIWLNAVWDANKKSILLHRAAQNAAEAGNGYLKIVPDGVVGKINNREVPLPRLVNIDPMWVEMDTNPEDFEQVIRYTIRFSTVGPDGKERLRKQVIEYQDNDVDGYWIIADYYNDHTTSGKWMLMQEVKWDYPFAPMIEWQNLPSPNSVYGEPDITNDVIELQDRLNFVASNINKIIRHHAHPKSWGINISLPPRKKEDQESSWNPEEMVIFQGGQDSKIGNLEMQSDLKSSMEFFDTISKSILDNTSTVDVNNLKDKLGQLTNFAVKVLFNDALSKMNVKRELMGDMLTELNSRLLELGGFANTDPGIVVWPRDVLPVNEKEIIEMQKTELEIGIVDKQTIATERGRDWEQVQERLAEEKTNNEDVSAQIVRIFERGTPNEMQ